MVAEKFWRCRGWKLGRVSEVVARAMWALRKSRRMLENCFHRSFQRRQDLLGLPADEIRTQSGFSGQRSAFAFEVIVQVAEIAGDVVGRVQNFRFHRPAKPAVFTKHKANVTRWRACRAFGQAKMSLFIIEIKPFVGQTLRGITLPHRPLSKAMHVWKRGPGQCA